MADVLILPSINEGLPLTVVEGLACGCNVVGSLVGGIPEVIGEDNCVDLNAHNLWISLLIRLLLTFRQNLILNSL